MAGKVWLVTGSSRGLGREIAAAALRRGDSVIATARDPQAVRDLVDSADGRALAVPLDVTDEQAAREAIDAGVHTFGRIDVVVNNAGYADMGSFEQMPPETFRDQIETNLFGVVNVSRAAIPVFREQRDGLLVQVSTMGGRLTTPWGLAAYAAAKHGVEGFSESLAGELKPLGARVSIIEPGALRTDWAGSSMTILEPGEPYREIAGGMIDLLRHSGPAPGDPAKAAELVMRLADMDEPPLRLPMGSDAVALIRAADHAKLAELDAWEHLSVSTDADDAVPPDYSQFSAG